MPDIAVIDYGMGNLRSVAKALAHVAPGADVVVSRRPGGDPRGEARGAARPERDARHDGARSTRAGLRGVVLECLRDRPFLGVCLGLQMLFDASEEGPTALPRRARRPCAYGFARRTWRCAPASGSRYRTWDGVPCTRSRAHPLWQGIGDGARFYFAHSYYPVPADPALTAGTASYPAPFTCAIARANIFAVQFHPEKSQRAGLQLLANFVAWDGRP